ncbi:MAG: AbrB/MazE/SpoVT family DNA-binding domain-containing protein [Clostridiales bacterium]|nr:AbrB/MazE/SpoVT family DNA-binding domain-containing protein [Clostridiales bacterium]
MNLAKVYAGGQVTVPIEIRKKLRLKEGDKLLFTERENGDVVIGNASATAIKKAQKAFEGAAKDFGFDSEDDVLAEVMKMRYGDEQS